MSSKLKPFLPGIIFPILGTIVLWCLPGCSTTDKYHNKRHIDTMKEDINLMHRDIDKVLGLDKPSPLVDE